MKVLTLGGSPWQTPLIETLERLGHETFLFDRNPECPGRACARHFIEADTANQEILLGIARQHSVGLVLTDQSDRFVPVAAYINEMLGLPGLSTGVALRFTDKLAMRTALQGMVDMPAFREVSDITEALSFAEAVGYPVIIKPKRSQSSFGVFKVDDAQSLRSRFSQSCAFSYDGRLLIEQFIDGPEVTVEGLSLDGHFHPLAISEKLHYDFNPCVARRLSYPPRYNEELLRAIEVTAGRVVEALGLQHGISHAEYRLRGDKPFLVEVAARGGGTRIASVIVPHICGFDVYSLLVRRLTGETVSVPTSAAKAAALTFLDFPAGKVKRIQGIDTIRDEGLASEIVINFKEGDEILRPEDDTQRLGYAIVLGENRDDVDARCQRIQALLKVSY